MSRSYSEKLVRKLHSGDEQALGTILGKLCVENNLRAMHVAVALGVSRASIHGWFRGIPIRKSNAKIVSAFIRLILIDRAQSRVLPVKSVKHSKQYIEDMIGKKI